MRDPLKPADLHVLLALASGALHGYALVQRIEEESDGRIRMLPGNLYAVLRRLELDGLLCPARKAPRPDEDQRRRYYELTDEGRRTLEDEARRMSALSERVRAVLGSESG
ncbi:MAG TPA: helix-turn-helix transcriptional regulator [Thermoanaerobaculia bacterium]|nr:helix-turn-helix transcriptional regulator [Thermoanaerobaculia bacterium]